MSHHAKILALSLVVGILSLTACSGSATPTVDTVAIYTQVAGTVQANLKTETAKTPSATPTTAPTDTQQPTEAPTQAAPASASTTGAGAASPTPLVGTQAPVVVGTATRAALPDGAKYQSQTPADGTTFTPGEKFTVTWVVKNSGTTTWNTKYMIRFYAGDQMSAPASKNFPKEVKPGETCELSVDLVAPSKSGEFTGLFALTNADGLNFSPGVSIAIKVGAGATATNTSAPTSAPTATSGPTNTPVSTATPTE